MVGQAQRVPAAAAQLEQVHPIQLTCADVLLASATRRNAVALLHSVYVCTCSTMQWRCWHSVYVCTCNHDALLASLQWVVHGNGFLCRGSSKCGTVHRLGRRKGRAAC